MRLNRRAPIVYTEAPLKTMPSSSPPTETETPTETSVVKAANADARQAHRTGGRWRGVSRWLGLGFFVFGSGLLIYVFMQALAGLARLQQVGALNADFNKTVGQSDNIAVVVQGVVAVFGAEFLRVLYLLVLGFIASAITARGIQFFAASESVIDEAVVSQD